MAKVERTALVAYSCEQMFDLVNDIARYPEFMVGCDAAQVLATGDSWIEARLTLKKGAMSQSFVTRNQLTPPTTMTMNLVEGPFSSFRGQWNFAAVSEQACRVTFSLNFEFSNRLLSFAASPFIEKVAAEQVDSLCRRAKYIYK